MMNMLKYTESTKEMTEPVDKLICLSYNTNIETGYICGVTWRQRMSNLTIMDIAREAGVSKQLFPE